MRNIYTDKDKDIMFSRSTSAGTSTITSKVANAIAEVAKYAVKESDLIIRDEEGNIDERIMDNNLAVLDASLAYRRLVGFGGVLRDAYQDLKFDNIDDGDLIHTDSDNEDEKLKIDEATGDVYKEETQCVLDEDTGEYIDEVTKVIVDNINNDACMIALLRYKWGIGTTNIYDYYRYYD
jgi:plasmid rolling circle replication initiator protein Rep